MNAEKVEVEMWQCGNCNAVYPKDKKSLAEGCCEDFNTRSGDSDGE